MLELALKARSTKDSAQSRHQKKLEEFLKAIEGIQSNVEEMRSKFREIMVKGNAGAVKEDDWIGNTYIETVAILSKQ
jgi:predicted translin family RNA/ssDNA-binding protein